MEVLGMANKQKSGGRQVIIKFLKKLGLGWPVKIDYDIPAENDIETGFKGKIVGHQVQALK